jgi:hypothetical protein
MAGRKAQSELAAIFAIGGNYAKRGTNAVTGRTGTMYEVVTTGRVSVMSYWGTAVVKWDRDTNMLTLNTGGYETVTTKALINAVLGALKVQARVYQTDHVWQVHRVGQSTLPFKDGITLENHNGDLWPRGSSFAPALQTKGGPDLEPTLTA